MLLEIDLSKKKKKKLHLFWTIPTPISTTKDVICCSNGYIYQEREAFIGENAKGTHGEIYKSHTSVISTHFVDQVQIFFFLTHCIVVNVRLETIIIIIIIITFLFFSFTAFRMECDCFDAQSFWS